MTTELLPCPFCGGEAALGYAATHNFVNCVDCSVTTNFLFAEHRTTEEEAIAEWNTRISRPAPSADAVALAELIEEEAYESDSGCCCRQGEPSSFDVKAATALLEAFRQHIWAEAREAAASVVGNEELKGEEQWVVNYPEQLAKRILALTPLERKER